MRKIQTCGGYNEDHEYSLSICFNDNYLVTLDGLSKEDMQEIKSCVDCMLVED
jgi:hypothetical protein